jgi:flavin reductase (DIM6/NTAB) family NADH-FMN oxidoreductase RutF
VTDRVLSPDTRTFRRVLGHFATGVTAVTAVDPRTGRPLGLTVNSFTSVSLTPPMVSFCVAETSRSWPVVRAAGRVCVNILGRHQRDVSAQFASPEVNDRFQDIGWTPSPGRTPVLAGALAWIDGTIEAEHLTGDHVIVVVRVHHLGQPDDRPPLVFFRGEYGQFQPLSASGRDR